MGWLSAGGCLDGWVNNVHRQPALLFGGRERIEDGRQRLEACRSCDVMVNPAQSRAALTEKTKYRADKWAGASCER
jgi:hypothetical protein